MNAPIAALRKAGDTSVILEIFIRDSTSTNSQNGLTGLTFGSAGLTAYYKRSSATGAVAISLADIATLGTFNAGGFKQIDATNLPGVYEFHLPDAALASGAQYVTVILKGATNMVPCVFSVQLVTLDLYPASGNIKADVQAMGTNVLTAAALATDAAQEIADTLLKRDMSVLSGEAARSPLNAFRILRNKVDLSGSTMTVRKEDDTTSAWTAVVTTDSAAQPIIAVDPA